jgi:hypothetical protein
LNIRPGGGTMLQLADLRDWLQLEPKAIITLAIDRLWEREQGKRRKEGDGRPF